MSEHTFIRLLVPVLLAIVYRDNDETLRHGAAKPNRVWLAGSDPPLGWPAVVQGVHSARSSTWLGFGGEPHSEFAAGYGVSLHDLLYLFICVWALLIKRALLKNNCVASGPMPQNGPPYSSDILDKLDSDGTSPSGPRFRALDGSLSEHGGPATPDRRVIRYEDSNHAERQGSLPACQAGNVSLDHDLHDSGSDVGSERSIDDDHAGSSSDTTVEHEESMCPLPCPTISGRVDNPGSVHEPHYDEATPRAARLAKSTGIAGQEYVTAGLTISIPRVAPSVPARDAQFNGSCVRTTPPSFLRNGSDASPGSSLLSVSRSGHTAAPGSVLACGLGSCDRPAGKSPFAVEDQNSTHPHHNVGSSPVTGLSTPGTCLSWDSFEPPLAHAPVPVQAGRIDDRELDPALIEGIRSLIVLSHARPACTSPITPGQDASTPVETVDQLRERHADLSAIQQQFAVCRARLQSSTQHPPIPVHGTHLQRVHGRIARLSGGNFS